MSDDKLTNQDIALVTNKPIKRKVRVDQGGSENKSDQTNGALENNLLKNEHEYEREGEHYFNGIDSDKDFQSIEQKAREDLKNYFRGKNSDPARVKDFSIRINESKNRSANNSNESNSYSIQYIGANGAAYNSTHEVYLSTKKGDLSSNPPTPRRLAYEAARKNVKNISSSLPVDVDGINLINLGIIDTNPAYHTLIKIYPIGYKCEIPVEIAKIKGENGVKIQIVVCEIKLKFGELEFSVTIKSNGKSFRGPSEEAALKKFEEYESLLVTSFFNLNVELLIEGLEGADECKNYLFHVERGYGDTYVTQEQANAANTALMLRTGREQRNRQRQQARGMDPEQLRKSVEERRKAEELDRHSKKLKLSQDREQKERDKAIREREKEELRRKKEYEKIHGKSMKSSTASTSTPTKDDKAHQQLKKEINAEMKKMRGEVYSLVLQSFDAEEDKYEQEATQGAMLTSSADEEKPMEKALPSLSTEEINGETSTTTTTTINTVLKQSKSCAEELSLSPEDFDNLLDVVNCLYAFRSYLKLQSTIRLDSFFRSLKCLVDSSSGSGSDQKEGNGQSVGESSMKQEAVAQDAEAVEIVLDADGTLPTIPMNDSNQLTSGTEAESKENSNEDSMTYDTDVRNHSSSGGDGDGVSVKGGGTVDTLGKKDSSDEEEWNEPTIIKPTRPTPSSSSSSSSSSSTLNQKEKEESEALFDRIHLCLVKAMMSELYVTIGLDDRDGEEARGRRGGTSATLGLPLNQMTWQEITRMMLVNRIAIEMNIPKDDIMVALRGSKLPNYRFSKNIVRAVRYRLAMQARRNQYSNNSGYTDILKSEKYLILDENFSSDVTNFEDRLLLLKSQIGSKGIGSRRPSDRKFKTESEIIPMQLGDSDSIANTAVTARLTTEEEEEVDDFESHQFLGEEAIITALSTLANNELESESYRRCSKILIRLLVTNCSKPFIWAVDKVTNSDYYDTLKSPLTLSRIASKLTRKQYGNISEKLDDVSEAGGIYVNPIVMRFYSDVRLVAFNCFAYNIETSTLVLNAHRLFLLLHRHVFCWILSENRPAVTLCDDSHCLLSGQAVGSSTEGVKCSRCNGLFAWSTLETKKVMQDVGYFRPVAESSTGLGEEWFCMFCMRETSSDVDSFSLCNELRQSEGEGEEGGQPVCNYWVDEWGASSLAPWFLNTLHSNKYTASLKHSLQLEYFINALNVLATPHLTSILPTAAATPTPTPSTTGGSTEKQPPPPPHPWSLSDRITVLKGLCELLKANNRSQDYLGKIYHECSKLMNSSTLDSSREADFIDKIRGIAGDEGVAVCRSLLDGAEGSGDSVDSYVMNKVTEGRCNVCMKSTFDGDCEGIHVILCDGCNAEAHLPCLKLAKVPSEEWYCAICAERQNARLECNTSLSGDFRDIRHHRRHDAELELMDDLRGERITGHSKKTNEKEICEYCGLGELELCSPFVVGQSRAEFDAHTSLWKPPVVQDYIEGKKDTVVSFAIENRIFVPPEPRMPFFPMRADPLSQWLLMSSSEPYPVVHEICALRMSQIRMDRGRHVLRRRRRMVVRSVVSMTGIIIQPLGMDSRGMSFWKFPISNDLFISWNESSSESSGGEGGDCRGTTHSEWLALVSADENFDTTTSTSIINVEKKRKCWVRLAGTDAIRQLTDLLIAADETMLRQNIITAFFSALTATSSSSTVGTGEGKNLVPLNAAAVETTTTNGDATMEVDAATRADNITDETSDPTADATADSAAVIAPPTDSESTLPVALKVLEGVKGCIVPGDIVIDKDRVFEENDAEDNEGSGDKEDDEEEEDDDESHREYFSFSRNKYYPVVLVDKYDRRVKMPKGSITVTFQIHRDSAALAYTPLSEPWTDHIFYFCIPIFKKSGSYRISFIVESMDKAAIGGSELRIPPLVYLVTVQAKQLLCGTIGALERLRAEDFLYENDRQLSHRRREVLAVIQSEDASELVAVKKALFMFYSALPTGCLQTIPDTNDGEYGDVLAGKVAETTGWNLVLDELWRAAVLSATTALGLMECLLLLEHYLNRTWFSSSYQRIFAALPSAHFAVRCASLASVSLRLFCLDKAMQYDKVQQPGAATTTQNKKSKSAASESLETSGGRRGMGGRRSSKAASSYNSRGSVQEDEEEGGADRHRRPQRAAALKSRVSYAEQDSDDDLPAADTWAAGGGRLRGRPSKPAVSPFLRQDWECECGFMNAARSRTCDDCGEMKPAGGGGPLSTSSRSGGRGRKPQQRIQPTRSTRNISRKYYEEEEDDDEEDEEEEEDDEEDVVDPEGESDGNDEEGEEEEQEKDEEEVDDDNDNRKVDKKSTRLNTSNPVLRIKRPPASKASQRKVRKKRNSDSDDDEDDDEEEEEEGDDGAEQLDQGEEEGEAIAASVERTSGLGSYSKDSTTTTTTDNHHHHHVTSPREDVQEQLDQLLEQMIDQKDKTENNSKAAHASLVQLKILHAIVAVENDSRIFWTPVDPSFVPNYRKIISQPMDLGTVARRVNLNYYGIDYRSFCEDVNLVWSNCISYNGIDSVLGQLATRLQRMFDELLSSYDVITDEDGDGEEEEEDE